MLPGITPIGGSKPLPTNGIDGFTTSIIGFDDAIYGTALPNGATVKDRVKPSRVWTSRGNGGGQQHYAGYFAGGSSLYCDGNGMYGPSSDPDYYFAGDFCIDFFCIPNTGAVGTNAAILGKPNASNYSPYLFFQSATTVYFYASSNGTSWDIANGVIVANGFGPADWHHLAVQRSGNVWTTWQNGVLVSSFTSSLTPMNTNDPPCVTYAAATWGGYIDEIRFSKTWRYGANFTPPDCPYAGVISGQNDAYTKVLCKMDGNGTAYIDSAAGKDPARWASPPIVQGAPAQMAGYVNAAGFGSSMYCAAVTDGLSVGGANIFSQDWVLGYRGSWTIDFWWYRTTNTAGDLIAIRNSSADISPMIIYDAGSGALQIYASSNNSSWNLFAGTSVGTVPINTWTHIAVVLDRSSGGATPNSFRVYINGTQTYSLTGWTAGWVAINKPFRVGSQSDGLGAPGYYDEVRFSNCARWRANFTRPAAPYSPNIPDDYTKVLLHFDNDIFDRSSSPHPFTAVGSPTMPGGTGLFGSGNSILLNGSKYLTTPQAADLNLGSNWTIEWWEYRLGAVTNASAIVINGSVGSSLPAVLAGYEGGGSIQGFSSFDGNGWAITNLPMGTPVYNAWCHRVLSRNGNTWYAHQDGVLQAGPVTISGNPNPNNGMQIGLYYGPTYFNGYIEEVRISTTNRYPQANFTPIPLFTRSLTPFAPP